jgi:hypothetical protein
MEYVKLRSWHIVRFWTRVPHSFITLCGRRGSGFSSDTFGDEKSCETCLRIFSKESA